MRALLLLTAILAAACAGKPTTPQIPSSGGAIAASDAQRMALAKNLNLKVTDKDGQRVPEKGPIPDLSRIEHGRRLVTIIFDRDIDANPEVAHARDGFARELGFPHGSRPAFPLA